MKNPYIDITSFLDKNNCVYDVIEHEAVYTSEQAARVSGQHLGAGAKSLVLKADKYFILVILPGNKKLDSKKLKKLLLCKNLRFATGDEVKQVMGCEIGACYPFGNLINIKMFVDTSLANNTIIFYNPGIHTKTIKMLWTEYQRITKPVLCDIT